MGGAQWGENRDRVLREADLCKDDIDLPRLQVARLDPDLDIFFETLLGMIKNELVSYQAYAGKVAHRLIENLKSEIANAKNDPDPEHEVIFGKEQVLNNLIDTQMRAEIEKYKIFDVRNEEKLLRNS
jgi:hypothetical protein